MNSIMERWVGSCRRELLDRTLVWNQRHLMIVLREYEDFYNTHRPHRALKQAAPLRQLPDGITDLDQFRVQRRDRAGGDSRISPGRVGFRHPLPGASPEPSGASVCAPQVRDTAPRLADSPGQCGDHPGIAVE